MEIVVHKIGGNEIAEIQSDDIVIASAEDGLELLGTIYYQGFDSVIVHERNIVPHFFDLKSGLAGDVLQKFSNYRVRIFIVGDVAQYTGKSLRNFIYESNKGKQVNFVHSVKEVIHILSKS